MYQSVAYSEMAKLYSSRHAVTSTTLAWVSAYFEEDLPPNVVSVGTEGPPWCRARENAVWIPGALIEGQCHVPFFTRVRKADSFQVLTSEDDSARLELVAWDALVALPMKIVSSPNMLLAVSGGGGGIPSNLPGYVEPDSKTAYFLHEDKVEELREGLLLTEVEPIEYRLMDVHLSSIENPLNSKVELEKFQLENHYNEPKMITREVLFNSTHVVYFGQTKGTFVNLPTNVSGPDIFPVTIRWGISNDYHQIRTHTVAYELPPHSIVNVTLVATVRHLDGPYTGRLISIYEDGIELERNIEGLHREKKLAQLNADFGHVVSLLNGSRLEEWPPKSTILLHSTTTTTTTPAPIASSKSSSGNPILPKPEGIGMSKSSLFKFSLSLINILLSSSFLHYFLPW